MINKYIEKYSLLHRLMELFRGQPKDRADLVEVLSDSSSRGIMDGEALNIILGALQVADMQAREIMVPRAQLVSLYDDKSPEEILEVVIESRHSRFPVVGNNVDDIKGILHAKDLLSLAFSKSDFDIRDHIRPAIVIPESKRLNILLQEFRSTRNHMAVVVDEYGHVSGVVTIEDVLEQIVGEIEDEYDIDDDSFVQRLDDKTFTIKPTMPIDAFNEYFRTDFNDEEFDTIGGIVLKEFGYLPERGESVNVGDITFEVLSAESRRLRLLRATLTNQ
tara:strand:- start:750 stop:1577 length:828 start_codon:yes stop_codon:yes gene_type:complete